VTNRRDLHIGITGDAGGFDKACQDAEEKAKSLDKELERLERQQAAQEKVTARTAAAVKQYGAEQDKAALAARRLGTEADKAAKQAEQAQIRAAAAADAYARGLIDEEKALRAAARAEDATERAAIKAAEAHRAAAKAADEQAQQERQLARDAELGAAAENLAVLKASGRVKEHNALLGSLEAKYGDLSKAGSGAFQEIETFGAKASSGVAGLVENFSVLGRSGPVSIGLVAAAIAALPTLATVAGGAVALGLGGALSLAAIKAQASASDVQAAFAQLKTNVAGDLQEISAPFHATLLEIAADAQYAFKSLEPSLAAAFAQMGPAISRFVRYFAGSLGELDPAIRSIGMAFTNVLDTLGPEMPTIIQNIGIGIKAITDAVASNPQALTSFVTGLSQVARVTGDSIGFLIRYSSQINAVFKIIGQVISPLSGVASALFHMKGSTEAGGTALAKYENTLGTLASTSDTTSKQISQDMQTLANATATVEARTTALTDAFSRLLDPQAAVYSDTLKLRTSIDDLGKALAASGGRLDDTTQASAAAGTAFNGTLKDAEELAAGMIKSGASIDEVRQQLWPYIGALAEAAGSNRQAQDLVTGFSQSLGLVAPALDTNGHAIGQFGSALNDLRAPVTGAQLAAQQLAEDMQTLSSKTATAEDKTNALSDAFTRLLDPQLAAYQDTAKLRQGLDDLAAALKKSHGALNDNTQAGRDAKDVFAGQLKTLEEYAGVLLRGGDSLDVVQRKLTPYILSLYKLAEGNKQARVLVDAFVRAVGLVPPAKGTQISAPGASSARASVDALHRSISNLQNRTVTVTTRQIIDKIEITHRTLQAERARATGGYVGYADGGVARRRFPSGGQVSGPGTSTSDSIPALLSNGEYVINARATAANRPLLEAINSGVRVPVPQAVASRASGGGEVPGLAAAVSELRAAAANLRNVKVEMDGKPVGQIVSRNLGQTTALRRKTG
jgi:hypothetical protein